MIRRAIAGTIAAAFVAACSHQTTAPPVTSTGPCSALSLAVGEVSPNVGGNSVCLAGGPDGATYTLIPFLNSSVPDARVSLTFNASGVTAAVVGAVNDAARGVPGSLPRSMSTAHDAFEARLRRTERRDLSPRVASARSWRSRRGSDRGSQGNAIPSSVAEGDLIQLNGNSDDNCAKPAMRTGRVVAITNGAVVVADQGNPAGGYTDAEYRSLGVTFDTLVDPIDRLNFGDPTDIDGNARVVLFFTKIVNDLTDTESESFIGGFFAERDLFPTVATPVLDGCAGSNVGEMFYLMVPDAARGAAFSKSNVSNIAVGTIAHEYQHLINASRRLYVNTAAEAFEEGWLNEGLSHIAEELLFYKQAKLTPRSNINVNTLQTSASIVSAFNRVQIANVDRFTSYLEATANFSPFSANDSLATRGATWSYLRFAADHSAIPEQTIWRGLVNSTVTGFSNLQSVFGTNPLITARDWATSIYTDDLVATSLQYSEPSWNLRSIIPELQNGGVYPLPVLSLATAAPVALSLTSGSARYASARVPAGATATISWSVTASSVEVSVVRVR